MRIAVGADHAGFALKEIIKRRLEERGDQCVDFGAISEESVDYPDYAERVAHAVAAGDADRGVLACGSGIGMAIAANKVDGVRAAAVTEVQAARLSREHNDANVIAVGARLSTNDEALAIVDAFLDTSFSGGRHQRRVDKIAGIERRAHEQA